MEATTVKFIGTTKFEIGLFQLANGSYVVSYEVAGKQHKGEPIVDFNTASFMFDTKLQELEGH